MKVLDLFSGIGGFSLGLDRAGFETVAFCEIEPYCQQILHRHWPDIPIHNDVRELGGKQFAGLVDVVTAGFPCQDISWLGDVHNKQRGVDGERSGLYREAVRLVREIRPAWAIFENVPALVGRGLQNILEDFATLGMDAEWHCIPASFAGAWHKRDRIWIIAHDQSIGVERLWPEGVIITRAMASPFVPLRGSDGQWEIEPDFRRAFDGLPRKLDRTPRLKALGNAVVPQIPEIIGRRIAASG